MMAVSKRSMKIQGKLFKEREYLSLGGGEINRKYVSIFENKLKKKENINLNQ